MNIEEIKQYTLKTFKEKKIASFPFSCTELLNQYEIPVYSYQDLKRKSNELFQMAVKFSNDAFTYNHIVCYNDQMPKERIRFSLMHELGHILLHSQAETDANYFASLLLAPRIILHQAPHLSEYDIRELFCLSQQAANVVYSDYIKNYKGKPFSSLSPADQALYRHFYNETKEIFVYKISECPICGEIIYNSLKGTCWHCMTGPKHTKSRNSFYDYIENSWLYPE